MDHHKVSSTVANSSSHSTRDSTRTVSFLEAEAAVVVLVADSEVEAVTTLLLLLDLYRQLLPRRHFLRRLLLLVSLLVLQRHRRIRKLERDYFTLFD